MLLNKVCTGLISLIVAGALQGSSATPVPEPSGGGLMIRAGGSMPGQGPAAQGPDIFYYDPPHMSAIKDLVLQGKDECNLLLSVKIRGQQVRTMSDMSSQVAPTTWMSVV